LNKPVYNQCVIFGYIRSVPQIAPKRRIKVFAVNALLSQIY